MEPLMATATVTGEVLGTPNETMRAQLGSGQPKLFTPWMAAHTNSRHPAAPPRTPVEEHRLPSASRSHWRLGVNPPQDQFVGDWVQTVGSQA